MESENGGVGVAPLTFSTNFLFGLKLLITFWKGLIIEVLFFSSKGSTQAYLLYISMTYNKNQTPLLNSWINWILAKSAP